MRHRHAGVTAARKRSRFRGQDPLRVLLCSCGGGSGETTQVVKPDLGAGQGGQLWAGVGIEIAQQTKPDPVIGQEVSDGLCTEAQPELKEYM